MTVTSESRLPPRKRRFLPRISLRTLLILVAILGIGLGLFGNFWNNLQKKRRAIALVEAAGGHVHYSYECGYEDDFRTPLRHFRSTGIRKVEGRKERTTKTSSGTIVDFEEPPGPKFFRRILGDNAFAEVDGITFWELSETGFQLDPSILAQFPELRVVILSRKQMDAQWLKSCAALPKLFALQLNGGDEQAVLAVGDFAAFSTLKELKLVGCSGDWVQDEIIAAVGNLRQVEVVSIYDAPHVTSAIFESLSHLPELRSLDIVRCKHIDDLGGASLAKLQKLHTLKIQYSPIGDQTAQAIGRLQNLECVFLSGTNVGDAGAVHLGKLTKLKVLTLDRTRITDDGVHKIASLKELRILNLTRTQITDSSLKMIFQMSELESLNLSGCPGISSESLVQLRNLKKLRLLSVGPNLTPEDLRELKQALPDCEVRAFDATGQGIHASDEP